MSREGKESEISTEISDLARCAGLGKEERVRAGRVSVASAAASSAYLYLCVAVSITPCRPALSQAGLSQGEPISQ